VIWALKVFRTLEAIAQALGQLEQAQQVIATTEAQIATTREALQPILERQPRVLMLAAEQLASSVQVANDADTCGSLVEAVGFQLVTPPDQPSSTSVQTISVEVLPTLDTDWVLIRGHNFEAINQLPDGNDLEDNQLANLKQEWESNAIAQSLKASQEGEVYFVPTYLCHGLPGPVGTTIVLDQLQRFLLSES